MLGLTLLAADIAVYVSLEHYLEGEIDDNLRNQARELSGTIDLDLRREATQPRVNVFIRFPNLDAFASPGMTVQVLNLDGRVIIQSENLRDRAVPIDRENVELAVSGNPSFATETVDGVPVRIYYARWSRDSSKGTSPASSRSPAPSETSRSRSPGCGWC